MIVLGIETSGETASIALRDEETVLASRAFASRASLCERLAAEIGSVLEHLGEARRPDAIAVSRGPGSFTSLRIGVVTAKAFAHRFGIPLVGVPTTEVVAWPFADEAGASVAVLLPAWNTALYLAVYFAGGDAGLPERVAPVAVEPAEAVGRLSETEGPLWLVGGGALTHRDALESALGSRARFAAPALCEPDAAALADLARRQLSGADPAAAFRLRPLYIVPSQAERTAGIDLGLTGQGDA
ncbi:MAG: tRNA (adenosine(37)-N6)-threonylcarbamoyltransferase complex dimerization subunit type 1 TsaB [Armatimonadetes bacterium]|nr:tRNA (adenosine(37)-N6)-threonylcarbamoyltransferase complex dimerization subunit type 1 TsaB [Armatimonadota bacterium]